MGEYSWGSRLCHASRASTTTTGGPYLLLQIWAWERIPSIRPKMYPFIWMPYNEERLAALPRYCRHGKHIWRARVPLVFWHIIGFHCPDRVMRQFGLVQKVPEPINTNPNRLHQLDLSGYPGRNWAQFLRAWIQYWNARANVEVIDQLANTFNPSNNYLKWYHEHIVLYILNLSDQNPQIGQMLQGASGQFEYLVCIYLRLLTVRSIRFWASFDIKCPIHTGPLSSRGRQRRHDQYDGSTVVEPTVQVIGIDTGYQHTPPVQQFTPFESSPVLGVDRGMAAWCHVSRDMFIPQLASMTIGAQATPSQQFSPFAAPPTPVADMYGFDPRFPSSSQLPPYEHVPMTGNFSSPTALHPIFTFLSGTGDTSSSLELSYYYSLGQSLVFPSTDQPSYASGHVSTGDFVTYRSTNNSESNDTSDALETDDVDPDSGSRDDPSSHDVPNHPGVVLGEHQRRRLKRFCCPSTTPQNVGKGKGKSKGNMHPKH
ncbi:unnamed protein product [Coffea canephora]|uniref:DH200=94 genomic scaffold, scaffold_230 n=1 Tax=Coffea canephora TaxID=49390 RepID=A0A068VC97_COFCA|nr:unnamed protein product [Coffea canephora]